MRWMVGWVVIGFAGTAYADSTEDFVWASQIANVIATADACGYELSKDKVDQLMADRVAKLDTGARANFYNYMTLGGDLVNNMTPTAKSAQCSLNAAVAKREGLTP